ncbi:MAG: type-F conjugative transfer system pilin assembly protein TraF [Alphaproteobacteria bacterium]|nr:type-F conjugative transfer system pilin assembly protein TraF [Methylococcaceae bacterium]MDP3935556.1 type-F conjugative transfer system pilin assembly protein TraF [Alphaproteobacteria bacterium]
MKVCLCCIVGLIFCNVDAHFFNEKAKGWHWYQPQRDVASDMKDRSKPSEANKPNKAVAELSEKRKILEEAMAESILRPTPQNIARVQKLHYQWINQSQKFSGVWMQNLLQSPELDATVKHPVTQYGIHLKKEDDQLKLETRVKALSQHYGLFFIYQGNCKFCQGMAGVVKQLSEKYGWKVLGISQDGHVLPEFPETKRDNGISQAWGIKGVPAVFVVNPETEQVIPIGHGLISLDQLERNLILQLFQKGTSR